MEKASLAPKGVSYTFLAFRVQTENFLATLILESNFKVLSRKV